MYILWIVTVQYFLAKIKKLADYFLAKIKKLTGWIFDKFLIKKCVYITFDEGWITQGLQFNSNCKIEFLKS